MDDIKIRQTSRQPLDHKIRREQPPSLSKQAGEVPLHTLKHWRLAKTMYRLSRLFRSTGGRIAFGLTALAVLFTVVIPVLEPKLAARGYALGNAQSLLPQVNPQIAKKLQHDTSKGQYDFNAGFNPAVSNAIQQGGPRISAVAHDDPAKGIKVTDPANGIDFSLVPQFGLLPAKQDTNRLVYPLKDGRGWLVYTMEGDQVKEDLLLSFANGDKITMNYQLELGDSLEARLRSDGAIGVYGSDLPITGNVSTGSPKDAELLQKARQKAPKNRLLFTLPAPLVKENNQTKSSVIARYELQGNQLKVIVTGLKKAVYPLTIDPSVYVESASKFMRGNNESDIDFDTSNELIQKGVLTGARIPSWSTASLNLNAGRWNQATAVAGGFIYAVGGSSGTGNVANVYWSKFNTSTYDLTSPNPGAGNCANWCTNAAYDLPDARAGFSLVAYNGYLYAIGGVDATNTRTTTVYYSKIGANGEPNTWNMTTVLSSERSYAAAVAYNNHLYLLGGQTNAASGGVTTSEYASINPDGTLGAWTGTTALMSARWGHSVQQYNGYLYLIGGVTTTTVQSSVQYIKINTDGSLASSWVTTTALLSAHASFGGNFATIWGGYLYVTGGCSAVTSTTCSTILSNDTLQLASLNADGTVSDWTSITGVTQTRTGFGLIAWRNTLYAVGGCGTATTFSTTSNCASALNTTAYGHINSDGDVSPKQSETTLPAIGTGNNQIGRAASGVVVNNGFIYVVGGCTNNGCTSMSDNTAYAPINADGTIGSWTVQNFVTGLFNNDNGINSGNGLGAFGATVYNNTIYAVGGTDGNNNWTRSIFRGALDPTGGVNSSSLWVEQTNQLAQTTGYGYPFVFARAATATTGNLYIISGCYNNSTGIGCGTYYNDVLKCTITNSTGAVSGCTTTNQLQIQDLDASTAGSQGLGLTAGAVWGDYIYLAGGACGTGTTAGGEAASCDGTSTTGTTNMAEINKVYVAKVDVNGNIVKAGINANNQWQIASNTLPEVRRREVAFAVNGYLYVSAGHDGTTGVVATLSDITFAKIDPTTGDLGAFTQVSQSGSTSNIISPRWNLGYAAANGYLYFIGGCTTGDPPGSCTAMAGTAESLQVYNNYSGSPKQYATTSTIGVDRIGGSATVLNGYIYYAGGCTNISCTTTTNINYYAPINADGTIGGWTASASVLPSVRAWGSLVNAGGSLYYIGGQNSSGAAQKNIFYTTGISSGAPTWATATKPLPLIRTYVSAAVYNNRIYVTGGETGGVTSNTVYYSPMLASGGDITSAWISSSNVFATARSGHITVAYGSTLYVIGGFDGTNYLLDVQYAPINSDGSVGAFGYGTSLPQAVRNGDGYAANGYLYVFGGRSAASTCTNNTYIAPILGYPPGSSNRYGIGNWAQTNVTYGGARYGLAAAYGNGRAYILGGGCAAFVASADRSYYSTLQAQPQISQYSIMIDADTDVFPSKWLFNGIDNGIGAQWSFNYQSATSGSGSLCGAMTTWGQSTNAGAITLGTPGTYTPKDGSGTNTNCSRYHFLMLTVDASQAFGYPEDVTRGPTIADLTLQFTADPSKRLIHGKTFTGGIQQPLDTPF